ncbi:hypothetical protein [Acetohalobium arabaticum]|uniref:Uncharacterized protein n=1 Tax=Acetohalobium arabaticum (strain ATCC 49924 / DSM 5501 / Z-7288) TaxID=574087 RepID=D9QQA3_ACEAZ|nr:hypothetical protein [Acetohalobium arabaticum]ADL12694.1 hypothetical protein Acear_1172 [Acetohalobium arabaticum DSM 5501]
MSTSKISECVLEHKPCTDCGECNYCDLDETKICDNCMECIEGNQEFRAIEVSDIKYE